ncbi:MULTISPECIES: alpha/beta hydrolase [Chromobacterium]|uniref:Alpha/beta hydrolase n=2 Tax=Chromobacterium TaxID=535 RepID=A0AAD0RUF9_9NEIS|nr:MULTISPECIES: alpha/beta hydrolase [Chromobacterium]AXT48712.1 alpha/beta hydrolase [Chromobacterium rhizoryzae]MDH0341374.1 alpha/beta hydrolase [Chromobacterium haemolyticum]QOD82691.1 alpha/beta hydrolase [Chromobacterium haemolyticum]BBH15347.1 hypothetical protein CH06BL_45950 [Chromobacterium haemolyticum]
MHQLDPALAVWLEEYNRELAELVAKGYKATSIGAREALANLTRQMVTPGPDIAWVNDDLVPGRDFTVPVRIYHPNPQRALPVLAFFHGGGHMVGSVSVYDPICRRLAAASQHVVVAADYRLAPESPYPAGLQDAAVVAKGLWQALDARGLPYARQLSLAGDSAGGALTSSLSALGQYDASLRIKRQVLIYPSVDYTLSQPSVDENGEGYLLTKARVAWYFDNYFQHAENRLLASPLHGEFSRKLPPTLLVSAGFDPLRDEAFLYADKLRAAEVEAEHLHLEGMVHAFLNLEAIVPDVCREVYQRIGVFLNR